MRRSGTVLLGALLLVAAVAVQVTVLARLDLAGAAPPLVLVATAAIGAARGLSGGAVAGFTGGLLLDLAPPADHPAGQWALVLTATGYLAGRLAEDRARPIGWQALAVAGLAALASAGYVGVSAVLGEEWLAADELVGLLLTSTAYAALLAVPVLPATSWLLDRTAPGAIGW